MSPNQNASMTTEVNSNGSTQEEPVAASSEASDVGGLSVDNKNQQEDTSTRRQPKQHPPQQTPRPEVPLVDLRLENVTYSPITKSPTNPTPFWSGKKNQPNRTTVLQNITTNIVPFQIAAWMGPSGSGKTSLLTVAANLTDSRDASSALSAESVIWVNGQEGQLPKRLVGVVWQDDLLLSNLTVQENVWFAARLKTPMSVPDAHVEQTVQETLAQLGLSKVQQSLVGNHMRRGISGGERKRVAIACELVARPSLLFLDEPTSGLDATTALELMQTLQNLARNQGLSIVTVIHQPRTSIFNKYIDSLLLLSRGRVVYNGPPKRVRSYLETCCGDAVMPLPPETGIADWIMDVIKHDEQKQQRRQQDETETQQAVLSLPDYWDRYSDKAKQELMELAEQFEEEHDESNAISTVSENRQNNSSSSSGRRQPIQRNLSTLKELAAMPKFSINRWMQFRLLTQRTMKQQRGDRLTATAMVLQLVYLLFTALFWWRLPDTTRYIFERKSLLFFMLIAQSNGVVVTAVNVFASERVLLRRERAKKMYGVASYFLAKTVSDMTNNILLPLLYTMVVFWTGNLRVSVETYLKYILTYYVVISTAQSMGLALSVAIPQVRMALVLAPPITLFFMIMGGFYTPFINMHPGVEWLSYLSFCRYGYSALLINEFEGRDITCEEDPDSSTMTNVMCPLPGEDVIATVGIKGVTESFWFDILMMAVFQALFRLVAYWMLRKSK